MKKDPKKYHIKETKVKCRVSNCMKKDIVSKLVNGFCSRCSLLMQGQTIHVHQEIEPKQSIITHPKELRRAKDSFQRYIRINAANESGQVELAGGGYGMWNKCDAGHYIQASKMFTCFDEMNVHPQSKLDNKRMYDGCVLTVLKYRNWLIQKYGEPAILIMEELSNKPKKYSVTELTVIADHFMAIGDKIKREKGL
jgi:hypothetical protein